jgi:hypothetical protein
MGEVDLLGDQFAGRMRGRHGRQLRLEHAGRGSAQIRQ